MTTISYGQATFNVADKATRDSWAAIIAQAKTVASAKVPPAKAGAAAPAPVDGAGSLAKATPRPSKGAGAGAGAAITGDTQAGCVCCGTLSGLLWGSAATPSSHGKGVVAMCRRDRAALGRFLTHNNAATNVSAVTLWKAKLNLAQVFKTTPSLVPGFRPGRTWSCQYAPKLVSPATEAAAGGDSGDDASEEDSGSDESTSTSGSDSSSGSSRARKLYDPFNPPAAVVEFSALPWHRWHRLKRRLHGMEPGRRRDAMEGQLLDHEQQLADVQMAKLHPLFSRESDIQFEADWVADAMPKQAHRERNHLRAIVLAKALIQKVVAEHADVIGKPLFKMLRKGMRCFDAQARRVVAIAVEPDQEASFRAVERRKQTIRPYFEAFVPVVSKRKRLLKSAAAAQKAFEAAEATRLKGTGPKAQAKAKADGVVQAAKAKPSHASKRKKKQRARKAKAKKARQAKDKAKAQAASSSGKAKAKARARAKAKAKAAAAGKKPNKTNNNPSSGNASSGFSSAGSSAGSSSGKSCFRCGSKSHLANACHLPRTDGGGGKQPHGNSKKKKKKPRRTVSITLPKGSASSAAGSE